MNDIDRIAEKFAEDFFFLSPNVKKELAGSIRAALLEYGAIVREECAKESVRYLNLSDAIDRGVLKANRRMNNDPPK